MGFDLPEKKSTHSAVSAAPLDHPVILGKVGSLESQRKRIPAAAAQSVRPTHRPLINESAMGNRTNERREEGRNREGEKREKQVMMMPLSLWEFGMNRSRAAFNLDALLLSCVQYL